MSAPARKGFFRNLIRAGAMGMAALSLAWGIALPSGLTAAVLCAALGVPIGLALGRSRLRLPVLLAGLGLLVVAAFEGSSLALRSSWLPSVLGTGAALRAGAAIRFGAAALGASAALRALATRKPSAASLEVLALAAAIPTVFASHRDGVIARPLWLSDFSWQRGIDPTSIFLGVGAASVAVLAVLLLAETGSGRAVSSVLAIAFLATLAFFLIPLFGMPTPHPPSDLGLTSSPDGGTSGSADGGAQRGDAGEPLEAGVEMGDGGDELDGGGSDDGGQVAQSEHLDEQSSKGGGEAPMAVVILDDDYAPPSQGFYLRQESWSQWTGARLVRATRGDVDRDGEDIFPTSPADVLDPPGEDSRSRVHATVVLLVEHTHPFALESPVRFAPAPNPNPSRFVRAYRFESLAQSIAYKDLFGKKPGSPKWSEAVRSYYTEAPKDPRYAELANTIAARVPPSHSGDTFATALTVKLWLDDHFTYSTKHKHASKVDSTADFLFGDKTGYCVHFAHAAVLLWRSLGIPARVGTGYRVEEDDRHGSSTLLVRSADAHAWPELYLEGAGWIVLDIAPKKTLDEPPPPVDSDLQRLLGEMARQMPPDPVKTSITAPSASAFGKELGRFLLLAAACAAALLYSVKLWRRLAPWVVRPAGLPVAGYRTTLDLLSEVGVARRFGESREAFAKRVGALAPSFEALTELHLRAALGAPSDDASREEISRARWREGLRSVRAEIRKGSKIGRRLFGVLDPSSFLRSR